MSNLKFKIFTIFPEIFPGYLNYSIMGEALRNNLIDLDIVNIRDYSFDKRNSVDDYPYGGGAGMVMRPDVIANAIDNNIKNKKTKLIYLSPKGKLFNQNLAIKLSQEEEIGLICGRYEGIDQRVIDEYNMEEVSIGNYVLSGGELPAIVMIDAITRNVDDVLDKDSLNEESFGNGEGSLYENLLEYPHYTKPFEWNGKKVPEILLSGHHQKIAEWRLKKAQETTSKRND